MAKIAEWNFTASGDGATVQLSNGVKPLCLDFYGTIGGGTITLQYLPYGDTTWKTIADISVTDVSASPILLAYVPQNAVRAVLTGATSPALTVRLDEVVTQ